MQPLRAWMVLGISAVLIAPSPAPSARPQAASQALVYNFDGDTPDKPPARFRLALTGQSSAGTWMV